MRKRNSTALLSLILLGIFACLGYLKRFLVSTFVLNGIRSVK